MPMTLGPIVIAACPGTGSFWLQQMLQEPDGCGLRRGGPIEEIRQPIQTKDGRMWVKKREGWRWDRHAPGPCTVTIIRNVDELLRSWFLRFRKSPPPPAALVAHSEILHPGSFYVYLGEINTKIDYWGPDFKTWLDAYLANAPGTVTALLGRFCSQANHVISQENLVEDSITMLGIEGIEFDEAKVRAYPRLTVSKEKPPWPSEGGYQAKLLAAG